MEEPASEGEKGADRRERDCRERRRTSRSLSLRTVSHLYLVIQLSNAEITYQDMTTRGVFEARGCCGLIISFRLNL